MNNSTPIILASQSPRRQQLLQAIGLPFEVLVREVHEYIPEDLHPRAVAVMISENKAKAYDDLDKKYIIITADTVVALGGRVFGKPANAEEATEMLTLLSDKVHQVVTGVTIFHQGQFKSISEETHVTFRKLRPEDIAYYIEHFRPFDKAGAYGIQEWIGMIGVTKIEGDYYNVMGLPLSRVYQELQALGVTLPG